MPFDAYFTNGRAHEIEQIQNLCQETGVIYAMDRGYIDYKSQYAIEKRGSVFVSRVKSNTKYKKIKNNPHKEDGPIVSDVIWTYWNNNKRILSKAVKEGKIPGSGNRKSL